MLPSSRGASPWCLLMEGRVDVAHSACSGGMPRVHYHDMKGNASALRRVIISK